jgi:hypothetical protein
MNPCYRPVMEGQDMGRFEKIGIGTSELSLDSPSVRANPNVKSLLIDAQNKELRLIISQPIEIATHTEMNEIFEDWGG